MSDMVERVARAIFAEFDAVTEPDEHSDCLRIARGAIEAMREPTEAMVDAGYNADNGEDRNLGARGAKQAWQIMIDEALRAE